MRPHQNRDAVAWLEREYHLLDHPTVVAENYWGLRYVKVPHWIRRRIVGWEGERHTVHPHSRYMFELLDGSGLSGCNKAFCWKEGDPVL